MKTITFTGHRPDKIKCENVETSLLSEKLKSFVARNGHSVLSYEYIVGGCPGFDTIALKVVLSLGIPKNQIRIAVPFKGFEQYATSNHIVNERVAEFNRRCEEQGIVLLETGGTSGTFGQKCYKRNQYMVSVSDVIFTNWDGSNGGTANTVKLARDKKMEIINIYK